MEVLYGFITISSILFAIGAFCEDNSIGFGIAIVVFCLASICVFLIEIKNILKEFMAEINRRNSERISNLKS